MALAGGQVDVPLQFVFLEEAVALYPNRLRHVRYGVGNGGGSDTSNQDRYGVHFARPFHYRDDRCHPSEGSGEQIELARSCVLRIGAQLVHP